MVHLRFLFPILASIFILAGCDGANRPVDGNPVSDSSGGGGAGTDKPLEITWPGGSVTIGDEGVEVKTPNVDVKTKPGVGTDVKAPGVNVSTSAGESVKVKTPTVDFEGRIEK
ncbi:MAG TPA: hypothetical protein DDZ51_15485 [Planctomycetaceae bacterium]|nr:hypothetical protein [Planctomycetaceae bacterium]